MDTTDRTAERIAGTSMRTKNTFVDVNISKLGLVILLALL